MMNGEKTPALPQEFDNPEWVKRVRARFAAHPLVWSALACFCIFFLLGLPVVSSGESMIQKAAIPFSILIGPLAGGVLRHQSCCMECSLRLLPFCVTPLVVASWAIHLKWPFALRMSAWVFGWIVWFGGAFVSFLHAFS